MAGRSSGYRSGAEGAQERRPVYPRRQSALSPAGPPSGKPTRRAEALSPAARTGPQSARRSRPRCPGAASPSVHGLSAASGTLAADRMPTPSCGSRLASRPLGRPPPGGCGPKTQGHGPKLGRGLHAALRSPRAVWCWRGHQRPPEPRGCGLSLRAGPWGRGSKTSARSPCVRTQTRLP